MARRLRRPRTAMFAHTRCRLALRRGVWIDALRIPPRAAALPQRGSHRATAEESGGVALGKPALGLGVHRRIGRILGVALIGQRSGHGRDADLAVALIQRRFILLGMRLGRSLGRHWSSLQSFSLCRGRNFVSAPHRAFERIAIIAAEWGRSGQQIVFYRDIARPQLSASPRPTKAARSGLIDARSVNRSLRRVHESLTGVVNACLIVAVYRPELRDASDAAASRLP